MADRIFGILILTVSVIYGIIAFTVIKAPFQYDPLGPESWPRILSVCAALCCLFIIASPDKSKFGLEFHTFVRVVVVVVMLCGYAYFFEPAGFIVSTTVFCAVFSRMFGARNWEAALFGTASGVLGYLLCVILLDLNLPKGLLAPIL
jgi:putative tricarboxylic transport membrane protein